MSISVIIASVGRPVELARWVEHVANQTVSPLELIFSISSDADLPADFNSADVRIVRGGRGLPRQRNAALEAVHDAATVIAFFDDDYLPSRHCLEGVLRAFEANPSLAGVSGQLLADGINGAGMHYAKALELVDAFDRDYRPLSVEFSPLVGAYGCNMAFRRSAIGTERFDERLPLYAWQEDVDFSRRLLNRGDLARCNAFSGVHQGVKSGRNSGRKLGYSQIANPLYLIGKGTMPMRHALSLMARNVAMNHARALKPEPWIDRRGRVAGNWRAVADLLTGRMKPERALEL